MHLNVTFIIITALDEKAELVNGQCILLAGNIGGYISGLLQRGIIPSYHGKILFFEYIRNDIMLVSVGLCMMNE